MVGVRIQDRWSRIPKYYARLARNAVREMRVYGLIGHFE